MDRLLIRLLLGFYLTNEIVVFVDGSRLPKKLFVSGYLNKRISSADRVKNLKHYYLLRVFVYKFTYLFLR